MYQLLVDYLSKADIMERKKKVSGNVVNYLTQEGLALPTIDNLVVLADLLGVKIDDIIVTDKQNQIQLGA